MEYLSDKPISSINDDIYGHRIFAESMTETLRNLKKDECFIIGIYASWGYGKTSTINLIQDKIKDDDILQSVFIDAWKYAGAINYIVPDIISGISEKITDRKTPKSNKGKQWLRTKRLPDISIGGLSVSLDDLKEIILSGARNKKLKETISDVIEESEKRIVVFIDNIDRLKSSEITELLRQVSQVANYGGVSYVLPFDSDYVSKSIQACLPDDVSGREFLEKIINIPLNLPIIPQEELDYVFLNALQDLLNSLSIHIQQAEIEKFVTVYRYQGLNQYVQSPRDIVRITNSLKFYLPAKLGEINIADAIVLDMVRLFDEAFYDEIRKNKFLLISGGSLFMSELAHDHDDKAKKGKLLDIIGDNPLRESLLTYLFPHANKIIHNGHPIDVDMLRLSKSIASEYYFDVYFSPINNRTGSSDVELARIINKSDNIEYINSSLPGIINNSNYPYVLRKIMDHKLAIRDKEAFCKCLLDVAGKYSYGGNEILTPSINDYLLWTIGDIIQASENRLVICQNILSYNFDKERYDSIPFLIRQTISYSTNSNGRTPLLSTEELAAYKKYALGIIERMSKKTLMPVKRAEKWAFIYHYWADFAGEEPVRRYTSRLTKTSDSVIDFIIQFVGTWSTAGKSGRFYGDLDANNMKYIERYIDIDASYKTLVNDVRYKDLLGLDERQLKSFHSLFDEETTNLAALGNEDDPEFRRIIAGRFIYYYEHKSLDGQ